MVRSLVSVFLQCSEGIFSNFVGECLENMLQRQKEELEKAEDESSKVMAKVVHLRKQVKKLENNYDLRIAYEQEMLDQEDRECGRSLTPEEFGEISGKFFLGLLESEQQELMDFDFGDVHFP